MAIDKAYAGVEKIQEPCVRVWRVNNFQLDEEEESEYGNFYRGDSYVVLAVHEAADNYNVHHWMGSESTKDETGTAAWKAKELDDALGGRAVIHREVEGHESKEFLNAFKRYGGIEVLDGGVDSGFNHVEPDKYEPRLLHVKGKHDVRSQQVELSIKSMNKGDVFILDKGLKLFMWSGPKANKYEKAKGLQLLQRLYNSRGARPEQIVVNDDPADAQEFWSDLGGSEDDVPEAVPDDDSKHAMGELKLYRVSDSEGELKVDKVPKKDGRLTKDLLDSNDVFLLDTGTTIYAWVGKNASSNEKKNSIRRGEEFIEKEERPSWCHVAKMPEGGETPMFKTLFYQWDPPPSFDFTHKSKGVAGKVEQKDIDAAALHKKQGPPASEKMVDDGSGEVKVWIIEGTTMSEYPENLYGQFFSGDSYVVQYTYEDKGSRAHMLYFWLGRHSDHIEQGSAAARVVELSRQLSEPSTQIRLKQGKEPPHFAAVFKGTMIVHDGGKGGQRDKADATRLYQVKGFEELDTKAVEVPASAENLNSGDCYVIVTPEVTYLWEGKGSNDTERATARKTAEILQGDADYKEVVEGEEEDAFWEALGGKADYPEIIPAEGANQPPRLFHVTDKTGALEVDEIFNFAQDDLMDDDVMILDTFSQVFVWIGSEANDREKEEGMKIAQEYVEKATDGRDEDTPIIEVHSGDEPSMFTCNFVGWDPKQTAKFVDPYEAKLQELKKEQEKKKAEERKRQEKEKEASQQRMKALQGVEGGDQQQSSGQSADDTEDHVVTPEKLEAKSQSPQGDQRSFDQKLDLETLKAAKPGGEYNLVWSQKERYLSDEEFKEAFGMTWEEYQQKPAWKRKQLKQKADLF